MKYAHWLNTHPLVSQYDVLRDTQEEDTIFIKLRITLIDGSVIHTKEYTDIDTRKYAPHWQGADEIRLVRWDNAFHFPNLISFPHHRHDYRDDPETVTNSLDISLVEVLTYIQCQLTTPQL